MKIEKPDMFNLRMEMKVYPKNNEDITGLGRAKEIEEKINKIAGFNFCGRITKTVQSSSKELELVTFIYHTEIKNFDAFIELLKNELKIDVRCKSEFDNQTNTG